MTKVIVFLIGFILSIACVAIPIAFVGAIAVHLTIDVAKAGWDLVGSVIN